MLNSANRQNCVFVHASVETRH